LVTLLSRDPALTVQPFRLQAGLVFAFLGIETKGRSIEEISSALDARGPAPRVAPERIAATLYRRTFRPDCKTPTRRSKAGAADIAVHPEK
jgi:hypothetical protein